MSSDPTFTPSVKKEDSVKLTLDDLRAWSNEMLNSQGGHYRDVTLDDLIEVLEGMGAQRIWWCETHDKEGVPSPYFDDFSDECWPVVWADIDANYKLCRMSQRLVLPLPTPEEG